MRLSIITINFNNLQGLIKTVNSVLHQNSNDFEYIIIDGGSTDGSAEYIYDNKKYFTFSISEPDKGIYNAMNKGINNATGEYLLFLNSGDIFFDNDILKHVSLVNFSEDIVFGNLLKRNGNFDILDIGFAKNEISFGDIYKGTINHPSSFIKRDLFSRIGLYDENLRIVSDWKFFFEAIVFFDVRVKYLNQTITIFDLGGISNTQYLLREKEREQVLNDLFPSKVLKELKTFFEFEIDIIKLKKIKRISILNQVYRFLCKISKFYKY